MGVLQLAAKGGQNRGFLEPFTTDGAADRFIVT